ncbi:hypothetical protein D3C86_1979710 [compost metagenome]
MILTESLGPVRKSVTYLLQDIQPTFEFDSMPLAIIKANGLDVLVTFQRPGKAGG